MTTTYRGGVHSARRRLRLDADYDLFFSLVLHRRGPRDPTMRLRGNEMWRATLTPDGGATIHISVTRGELTAEAWGPGQKWVLDRLEDLVGASDDPRQLVPCDPVVRDLVKRRRGLRIGRTNAVMEALVPAILEQKVTSYEAHASFRRMTYAWGDVAPGPMRLRVPVDPARLAGTPYYEFHRFGIERKRADVIRAVCARAARLEECVDLPPNVAERRLRSFAGVGAWTAAEVAARALGDDDAVSLGDFHLPHLVSWAMAGEPRATDERMLELLAPYAGQRGRVIRLIESTVSPRPRRAPRQRIRSIARI